MAAQHDVAQAFPFHHIDHVDDVSLQVDPGAQQVRSLAEPGQRRRENRVAAAAQPVGDAQPTPTAMPGAVDEDKSVGHEFPPHGCQAASVALASTPLCRAWSITFNKARNTSATPSPLTAEITSGAFFAARLSRATCCLISSAL